MPQTTIAVPSSRQTSAGSSAPTVYKLAAGLVLVAALVGRPASLAAAPSVLPELPAAPQPGVPAAAQPVAPVAAQLGVPAAAQVVAPAAVQAVVLIEPTVVVVIAGELPPAPVATPLPPAPTQDGVSDRDGWAREPAARVRRAPATATPAPPTPPTPAPGKFVPETPLALKAPIAQAGAKYGIPTEILSAALARESGNFNEKWVYGFHTDGTGRGVAGIDKVGHPEVSDQQALDPNFSIDWMARYLSVILRKNGGDIVSALREYNGGPNFNSTRVGYLGRTVRELTQMHAGAIMAHAARAV
jgi:hypothetical protein